MSVLSETELATAMEGGGPNVPEKLGAAHVGTKAYVGVEERRIRRASMTTALASGVSKDELYTVFAKRYGMTEGAVDSLRNETRAAWDDEDAEMARYAKQGAKIRIRKHILKASGVGSWTAVANLEKVLMDIEGTAEIAEQVQSGESRLTEAILGVLGSTDEASIRILIEKERMYIQVNGHDPATTPTIPTFDEHGVAQPPT